MVHDAGNQVYFVGARGNWYPNRRMQFATYDLTFRYPARTRPGHPGAGRGGKEEGAWRVTRRRTASPIRMAGFNLGHYDKARAARGRYTVEVYGNQKLEKALERPPLVVVPPPPPAFGRPRQAATLTLPESPPPQDPRVRLQDWPRTWPQRLSSWPRASAPRR